MLAPSEDLKTEIVKTDNVRDIVLEEEKCRSGDLLLIINTDYIHIL